MLKSDIANILGFQFNSFSQIVSGDERIANILRQDAINKGKTSWQEYLDACQLICDALPTAISIDNLMDAHRGNEFVEIAGKLAITKAIWSAERNSKLTNIVEGDRFNASRISDTWLIPFFQILTENVRLGEIDTIFNNLTIINFNYDRCIEYFLPYALWNYYSIPIDRCIDICQKLSIIHPYGTVGQNIHPNRGNYTPFGTAQSDLLSHSQEIRTFCEGMRFETHREIINNKLTNAEQVVFIGFAFHPINMDMLEVKNSTSIRKVFGTSLNIPNPTQKVIESDITRIFKDHSDISPERDHPKNIDELSLSNESANNFLHSYFRSIA